MHQEEPSVPLEQSLSDFPLLAVNDPYSTPVTVDVLLEGKPVSMVVVTGAAVSLLPESVFKDLFPDTDLQPSDMVLQRIYYRLW